MRKTRRKQLVEIKGRMTGRKLTRRIFSYYPQRLHSSNDGLIFLNRYVKFSKVTCQNLLS